MATKPTRFIQVKGLYQGRLTPGGPIKPGIYAEDDPRLQGLADYLIKNDHAILLPGMAVSDSLRVALVEFENGAAELEPSPAEGDTLTVSAPVEDWSSDNPAAPVASLEPPASSKPAARTRKSGGKR